MTALAALPDPTDLDALRAAVAAQDPDGRLPPLGLRRLVISPDATDLVTDAVAEELARAGSAGRHVVLLVDATPVLRDGERLKERVQTQLGKRFPTTLVVLRGEHEPLHADEATIALAVEAVRGADCVVSIGGGTVTDVAKVATARVGCAPLVVVQTAASVDGYTDDVSVVLQDGVKRTIPSRWPDVVLADLTTIAGAPAAMNGAGYGELLSLFTAPADWYLASLLGLDNSYHDVPYELLALVGRGLQEWSPGVAEAHPTSVAALTRALDVRGIVTGMAGTTACLSGVEHLVSHMLDMHHGQRGLPVGLHGAQVGVASLVAAAVWESLVERLDALELTGVDPAVLFPEPGTRRARVEAAFAGLDPSGRVGAECWRGYRRKLELWNASRDRVECVLAEWPLHRERVVGMLADPDALGRGLRAARVPAGFDELDPAVDGTTARWAVDHCHLMRDRFSAVDLLDLLGAWTQRDVDAVLDRARTAVPASLAALP